MTLFPNLITIFNEALLSCGEVPISENDNSAFAALFRSRAENIARRQLLAYSFSFSRKEVGLSPAGVDHNNERIYNLPADLLKIRKVELCTATVSTYKVVGKTIVSPVDSDALNLVYTYPAPIETWSADFSEALVAYYEGLVRKSVLQDYAQGNQDMAMAKNLFVEASAREFNSTGNRERNDGGSIIAAHYGAGRHG